MAGGIQKIKIGLVSNYVPHELVEVFGIPERIIGGFHKGPTPESPSFTCGYVRDLVAAVNSGELDHLSGVIIPQSCDSLFSAFDLMGRDGLFTYRYHQPILEGEEGVRYQLRCYKDMIRFLEDKTGVGYGEGRLKQIISAANQVRHMLRQLGQEISGNGLDVPYSQYLSTITQVMRSRFIDSVDSVRERCENLKKSGVMDSADRRIMVVGPILDNFAVLDTIESFDDTKIVADNVTNGARFINGTITEDGAALAALSRYYSGKLHSPSFSGDHRYLGVVEEAIDESAVNGVVLVNQRGCEVHGFQAHALQDLCDKKRVSYLTLNVEHSGEGLDGVSRRLQTFLEAIG